MQQAQMLGAEYLEQKSQVPVASTVSVDQWLQLGDVFVFPKKMGMDQYLLIPFLGG